jgi:hypothetical protein
MLCSYCKTPYAADEVSCPNCGAPLPAPRTPIGDTWDRGSKTGSRAAGSNTFGVSQKTPPNFQKRKSDTATKSQRLNAVDTRYSGNLEYGIPQPLFETYPPPSSQAQPIQPIEPAENQSINPQQALLPVPYQEMPPAVGQTTMSLQLIPDQVVEHLLPAMPETVHMPPIYTKPRPIIPKYQAISSFMSFIIVALLLCGGGVYYAQTTGKLSFLHQITGNTRPPSLQTGQAPKLPDPPDKVDMGPAYNIIPSAATALRIDPKTDFVIAPVNVFSPGQPFYLSFSVISPGNDGRVYTKWYTNNQYFTTVQSKDLIKAHSNESGSVSITYPQATEGSVELYWNDQLAQRLYFVVR